MSTSSSSSSSSSYHVILSQKTSTMKVVLPVFAPTLDDWDCQQSARYKENHRKRRNWLEKKRMHDRQNSIQSMRQMVRVMEQQYEARCARADALQRPQSPPEDDLPGQDSPHPFECASIQSSSKSHYALAQQIRVLVYENAHLREQFEHHEHFHRVLLWISQETRVERPIASSMLQFDKCSKLYYESFSMDECFAIIRRDLAQTTSKRPDFESPVINTSLPIGWHGMRSVEQPHTLRLQMTKVLPETPNVIFERMWKFLITEVDPRNVYWESHCYEILQHVSDDIKVARRRTYWHGWTSWSVFLLYRTTVGESYLIGCVPLPLRGNETPVGVDDAFGKSFLDANETMVLLPLHHVFEPVTQRNHVPHTRIYRWGAAVCDTDVLIPLFHKCSVDGMLRLESLVLCPVAAGLITR